MADELNPITQPDLIDFVRFGANGRQVNAPFLQRMGYALNHSAAMRVKLFASGHASPASPAVFGTGTPGSPQERFGGMFLVGSNIRAISFHAGQPTPISHIDNQDPVIRLKITDYPSGSDYRTDTLPGPSVDVGAGTPVVPQNTATTFQRMKSADVGAPMNQQFYTWVIEGWHYARLMWFSIIEHTELIAGDAGASLGLTRPSQFVVHAPILTKHYRDLVDAVNGQMQYNGAHLLQHQFEETYTSSSGVYNPILGSAIYQTMNMQYRDTRSNDVRVRFAVETQMAVSGTGGVRLFTDGAVQVAEVTPSNTTRGWSHVDTTIPATDNLRVRLEIKGDALSAQALTLFNYSLMMYDPN